MPWNDLNALVELHQFRFDLYRAPMMKAYTAHDACNCRWLLRLFCHHLIADHVSGEIIEREIKAYLQGNTEQFRLLLRFATS